MSSFSFDTSPPVNRDMKDVLNRDFFKKTLDVLAAKVPAKKVGMVQNSSVLKRSLLDIKKTKIVVPDPAGSQSDRLVLLGASRQEDLSEDALQIFTAEDIGFTSYKLELSYDYWTADQILQAILPEHLCEGSPVGFTMTGHIAHMNLLPEYLPYKYTIGQIILDKNKRIKTVVNKLDSIDTQFRFFKMELIAGEPNYIVEHHEADCRFTFDFTQVYWNSRLHTEHERLVRSFKPEDIIVDVMAGVGPFAIPAAKKGCAVLANDLNPNSAKYLEQNIRDNRVTTLVRATCEDGRDSIHNSVRRLVEYPFPVYTGPTPSRSEERRLRKQHPSDTSPERIVSDRRRISHYVMNLPDTAILFLDAFRGILNQGEDLRRIYDIMPMVHCYCFTKEAEPDLAEISIRQRAEEALGHPLGDEVSLFHVRSVAPNKEMYCISFRLPSAVAYAE